MFRMLHAGDIGNYYYGQGHPMKPQRIRMCHNLLLNYGLYRKMEIYVSMVLEFMLQVHCALHCKLISKEEVVSFTLKSLVPGYIHHTCEKTDSLRKSVIGL